MALLGSQRRAWKDRKSAVSYAEESKSVCDVVVSASNTAGVMHDDIEEEHGWRWTTNLLCSLGRSAEYARAVQTTSWACVNTLHRDRRRPEGITSGAAEVGDAFTVGTWQTMTTTCRTD